MKKIGLIIIIALLILPGIYAQKIDDAFRNSQVFYYGTARFMGMGGAFTALGGDLSSLSQNPAGLGIFRSSEVSVTPQLFHVKTSADFDGISSDYLYDFNLSQAGIVANIINNNNSKGLITLNLGYSFNKTNNLNQNVRIEGISSSSSLADYWAANAEGSYHSGLIDLKDPSSYLAYETFIIDTLLGSSTEFGTVYSNYGDNPPSIYGQNIRRLVTHEGYTAEHAFSVGGNYSNKLYFGATVGLSRLNYSRKYEHLETTDENLPSRYPDFRFTDFNYSDYFRNTGFGFSLKIGAIFKPVEPLRLGLAFHSPVFYKIDVYMNDNLTSNFGDGGNFEKSNGALRYNYALTTPFRAMFGAAFQLKKLALFSADYEFVDYGSAKFSETGDGFDYSEKNLAIKDGLKQTNNIRLGAEVRLSNIYLRGGYGYYGKAFWEGDNNEDLDYNSISFGGGFREQNVFIDVAFTRLMNSQTYVLYQYKTGTQFVTSMTNLNINRNIFTVTFGYKFGI